MSETHAGPVDLSEKYRQFLKPLPQGRGQTSDYLEVKYRLMWLREEHPSAQIETTLVQYSDKHAIFKADITVPRTTARATGYGSETQGDFKDYLEKAETKAIGRALAALGYGTQFCQDFDEGVHPDGSPNIVDSPVQRPGTPTPFRPLGNRPASPPTARPPAPANQQQGERMATKGQLGLLWSLLTKEGLDNPAQVAYRGGENAITFDQVKHAIDFLQGRANEGNPGELPDWKIVSGQIILDEPDDDDIFN